MKRREFIAGTAALLVPPRHLHAQTKPRRIGFLGVWADEPVIRPAILALTHMWNGPGCKIFLRLNEG